MMRTSLATCAAITVLLAAGRADAGVALPRHGRDAKPLSIRHHHVSIEVDNQVATTTVRQTFENHTGRTLDTDFHFALPEGAAVVDFAQWLGDERIGSEMVEKARAKQSFARRKARGERPALLEQLEGDVFRARLSGIPPTGTRRTELVYSQSLTYDGGTIRYTYPFDLRRFQVGAIDRVSFGAVVRDQKPITSAAADRWLTGFAAGADGVWASSWAGADVAPDRDVSLTYHVESRRMGINFLPFKRQDESGYFVLMIAPQELTGAGDIVNKDVVFVCDTSGSMRGAKLAEARAALKTSVAHMNPGDGFGIVGFASSVDPMRNRIVAVTDESRAEAVRFIDGLGASGGTNISGGLTAALAMLADSTRPTAVVFVTDGQPSTGATDPTELAALVRTSNRRGTRLFAFGVGADVNRRLLERLGADNRGDARFLDDGHRIDELVAGFYASVSKPVLSDLRLDFGGEVVAAQVYPSSLPDVYKGQQLVIVGRYRGAGAADVVLSGDRNGTAKRFPIPVAFPPITTRYPFVPRVWAEHRVAHLLREMRLNGENGELKSEVIDLARRYRIVTPYTSFVSERAAPQLASLTPVRLKPGDPEIRIQAPPDARRVTAHFPFGVRKRAVWDPREERWVVRFVVPKDTPDGVYQVRIEIVAADGRVRDVAVSYTVDTRAPALAVRLQQTELVAGTPVVLRARPVVTPSEVLRGLDLGSLAATRARLEALVDVRRVEAVTDDGRRTVLRTRPGEPGWHGVIETEPGAPPGRRGVTVTAVDIAGNVWRQRLHYELRAAAPAGR